VSPRTKYLAVVVGGSVLALFALADWLPVAAEAALVTCWFATLLMVRELYADRRKEGGEQ